MYDHDLRLWYRDLFLHSARRRAAAETRARAAKGLEGPQPRSALSPVNHEFEVLNDHECETARHGKERIFLF